MEVICMNSSKLEVFIKTADLGSLTKAADALGYTQSGVSYILAALEEEWKVRLFIRGRSGAKLTEEGRRLMPLIRSIANAERSLSDEIDSLHGLQSGTLRIGSFQSISLQWLPAILKKYGDDYPNVECELLHGEYDEIIEWLSEGRIDCGFLRFSDNMRMEAITLAMDEFFVALPEDHHLVGEDTITVDQLREEEFILVAGNLEHDVTEFFRQNAIVPKVRFTASDYYAIMAMVEVGLGITIQPELAMKRTPYRIVRKHLATPYYRKIGFAFHSIERASTAAKRFVDYLKYRDAE